MNPGGVVQIRRDFGRAWTQEACKNDTVYKDFDPSLFQGTSRPGLAGVDPALLEGSQATVSGVRIEKCAISYFTTSLVVLDYP